MTSEIFRLAPIEVPDSGRVATRVAAIFPVELVMSSSEAIHLPARAVDIGMGGLCVTTASIIDGAAVRLVRFRLGRHDLEFTVQARWNSSAISDEGPLIGFAFDHVDARSEKALWNFMQERGLELATFLRSCGGLSHLDFQDALELALTTRIREVEFGEVVYGGNEPSGSIFVLFRGSILLERAGERRNHEIAVVQPYEFFGGVPLVAGCEPVERAVATSSATLLEFVEHNTQYLLRTKPLLGTTLLRAASFHLVQRVAKLLDRMFDQKAAE